MKPHALRVFCFICSLSAPLIVNAAGSFSDITDAHPYVRSISYVREQGIAGGFGDGTFRSDRTLNRAEALKLIMSATADKEVIDRCLREEGESYDDVARSDWFAPFVCQGVADDVINAKTQNAFRPADKITVAEFSAMLARAFKLNEIGDADPWYAPFMRVLGVRNAIPSAVHSPSERVTRGQAAEMIWRIAEDVRDQPSANVDTLLASQCNWFEQQDVLSVDDEEVVRQWFSWVNAERKANGLAPYSYDKQLSHTAALWSQHARDTGTITHTRPGQTSYYDYNLMKKWFLGFDLAFANEAGSTFTENIGWGMYRCSAGDCTQKMIDSVRTTFDMYMREKGKPNRPHYNSIVNSEFTSMGFGLVTDAATGKYYLTVHYGTEVTSQPDPICP